MKKFLYLFLLLILVTHINAQVGINTKNPQGILHIDSSNDNEGSSIKADQAINDFIVTSEGNVGIGTLKPKSKLSVNGNFVAAGLNSISNSSGSTSTLQNLYIDESTKELLSIISEDQQEASVPINYVTYTLNNAYSQTLTSYDTKINSSKYLVFIAGYTVNVNGSSAGVGLSVDSSLRPPFSTVGTFTGLSVQTIDNGSTWSLSITFPGSTIAAANAGKIIWQINCLIIDKSIVQVLEDQVYDFGGSSSFWGATLPVGL